MATRRKSRRSKNIVSKGISSVKRTTGKVTSGVMGVGKNVAGTVGKTIPAAQSGVRGIFGMFGMKSRKSRRSRKSRKSRKR